MYYYLDYNPILHQALDDWINENKYSNAKQINQFAFFKEPLSQQYNYFLLNPYDMANIKSVIKIVKKDKDIIAIIIFHYSYEDESYFLTINPIVVNPNYVNQKHGQRIIEDVVLNANKIIKGKVDYITCSIDNKNDVSKHIFEKMGFKKISINNDFIDYKIKMPL